MKRVISFFLALIMIVSIATVSIAGAKSCSHKKSTCKSRELLLYTKTVTWTTNCTLVPGHNHMHYNYKEIWWEERRCKDCKANFTKMVTDVWYDCMIR